MCRVCRGIGHEGTDCPEDFALEATIQESINHGWRRCYKCHAMVELMTGCRHITCKCKAEFCYCCGAVWQTCSCTELDLARRRNDIQERLAVAEAEAAAEAAE